VGVGNSAPASFFVEISDGLWYCVQMNARVRVTLEISGFGQVGLFLSLTGLWNYFMLQLGSCQLYSYLWMCIMEFILLV